MFDFEAICNSPMGSSDFLSICRNFHTIFIKDIPYISVEHRNLTRRFILLVNTYISYKLKIKFYLLKKTNLILDKETIIYIFN